MNPYLKQMIELSDIDNQITEFDPEIEKVKGEYQKIENERSYIVTDIEKLRSQMNDMNNRIQTIEENLDRMAKEQVAYESKIKEVKKEKELEALKIENELRREQTQYENGEIERYNGIKDSISLKLSDKEKELEEFEAKLGEAEKSMASKLEQIQDHRKKIYGERDDLISNMDKKIYSFYGKIRRWAKETTAVPVKDQACYGCFMKLSDQTYLEVIKGEDIITCPNCGRLLYIEQGEEDPVE